MFGLDDIQNSVDHRFTKKLENVTQRVEEPEERKVQNEETEQAVLKNKDTGSYDSDENPVLKIED